MIVTHHLVKEPPELILSVMNLKLRLTLYPLIVKTLHIADLTLDSIEPRYIVHCLLAFKKLFCCE